MNAGDTGGAANIAAEIALGAATDGFTGDVVAFKIASAVEKFGLAALVAKIFGKFGGEATAVVSKKLTPVPRIKVCNIRAPDGRRFQQNSVIEISG